MLQKNSIYFKQAKLLLSLLPFAAKESAFALKGGTAINLFVREMPRLSVDIDLAYIPIEPRTESLSSIKGCLERILKSAEISLSGLSVQENFQGTEEYKLFVRKDGVQVKIEPNLIIRGCVFPCEHMKLSKRAQEVFEMHVSVQTLSFADIYAGKLCAALDRQHPRDLFDVKLLLDNEGITEKIRKAFIVYLVSHNRPIHELLNPKVQDISKLYETEFASMTTDKVSLEELNYVQKSLSKEIIKTLTNNEKQFLLSIKNGEPNWSFLGLENIDKLPAVQWKLSNISRMNKNKQKEYLDKLKSVLGY